ncbi:hypothetical protein NCS57_01175400 [Fusarium keratoplasticum]|uniref:Uncharacterized protein n=1 Tax=Fusarium keratoplasticum TaxID=1328300 RepID=A0ACC0QMA4_9HYPO|nr:hypothetical protein NCS57_01175400 [Fusarium keratoplasticum]KAI8657953.1 hypothetical protein NCS57_01175400 [Fusarium keratoplasticum]
MPGANLDPSNTLMGNEVESHEPQVSIQESPREALFDMQFELEQIVQLDAMEIEADINNSFSLDSLGMWDLDGDGELNRPTPYRQPSVTMVEDPLSPGTTSSPRPQYSGRRLSPISQFFNFEIFDTRPSFQLMTNLPWFKLQTTLEQLDFTTLQMHPLLDGGLLSPTGVSITLPPETRRGVLLNLLGPISDHQLAENVSVVTNKLQRSIPERCEGELSHKIAHILDSRSTSPSSLSAIFSLAAYFASNNKLMDTRMDTFLNWVIDQKYTEHLERFLQINTPTIHAFATQILKSAVRVQNVKFLTALMDLGVKFDSILDKILQIGDMDFMKLVLSRVSPTCFHGRRGVELFHLCVEGNHFDLARMLATKGANVDGERFRRTPLYSAVSREDVHAVTFLLELGADVNKASFSYGAGYEVPLARAVLSKESDIVAVLLKHNANTSCKVEKQDIMQWSSLNCRNIYRLLQEHMGAIDVGFTIGDLVDAANEGNDSLNAYLQRQRRTVSKQQLEQALSESIRLGYIAATNALLKHGVSPNCPCLDSTPLRTALQSHKQPRRVCELLIKYKADVNGDDILKTVVRRNDSKLLQIFIEAGVNLEEQGMEAMVEVAKLGHTSLAAFLLHLGVDVNTPGLEENPLQAAARMGELEMLEFLLDHGADINAPAYLKDGRTALQAALEGETPETAWFLLDRGADIFGPPALLVGGVTALEAACHNWIAIPGDRLLGLCNYLLDSNAPVNRPNGKPSSALHGAIERRWDGILARMLEPQRNAIINHIWHDRTIEEDEFYIWEPRTPTQLAAANGQLEAVKMLVGRGADINEAPAYRFGRTALQAATSRTEPDMDLVQFLLDNGADVNAKPAVYGGITALQGSAISGDIMLAKRLIDNGADVNGAPSYVEGRYAIEGAAEHGRLDMVQLLLNAGARGNVLNGMGFKRAIELATKNEHFAIANLLKNVPGAEA